MIYPDRLRLPLRFDPVLLARDLQTLASVEWIAHFVQQNYEGDWSVIPLRSVAGSAGRHPIMTIYSDPCATAFEDTPMLAACPYFREVLAAFACEVQCVRLMRLAPGSVIKEHRDDGLDAENGFARIHIPITTNPGVRFELNRSHVEMAPGEAWYLRFSAPHSVTNAGATDRVHLVVDAVADDGMRRLLDAALKAPSPLVGEGALAVQEAAQLP
jgi:hypothetical protein